MFDYKESWKKRIASVLNTLIQEAGGDGNISPAQVIAENPPNPEMGDIGFPMFSYAKQLRKGPPQIAGDVCSRLAAEGADADGTFKALGPYVNVHLRRPAAAKAVVEKVLAGEDFSFARPGTLSGKKVMVEFSSPNTNKPLHLGHLRNDVLGESISRILMASGVEVRKVCVINDRGIHICKSMLAYKEHGGGKTPESEGIKSDHFVGEWYVCFSRELKNETAELSKKQGITKEEAEARSPLMAHAQELLRKWEDGDTETVSLWKQMNSWAIDGMKKTYERTGISFDKYYFESDTYLLGKDEVIKGLERGLFYRESDGAVVSDLSEEKLGKKILLRGDGTSIYITQDLGLAINRHNDWQFDQLIYVVGSEQQYHFKVLFVLLDKLGYPWAKNLYHLSYGMVNLPEGKMKSREGTVVDADDLIDSLRDMALAEIKEKQREEEVGNPMEIAEKIALGALHYYLLQVSPSKDMLFDPKESLSFNGNTGPYLQYMGARICSMLRASREKQGTKDEEQKKAAGQSAVPNYSLLVSEQEWELIKTLAAYPDAITEAAANLNPTVLAGYLYELSKSFSRFYHDCPVLNAENPELAAARMGLSRAVLRVLRDAMNLICISFLEVM
ncbi:MAG: arginine--tRNA ligase [Spirochaetaceae bacterium]|jgi:arginyl-tRNA synthetase|nr:arginine--tRNA ligase [Spirochaetaceae bacterium]